MSRIRRLLVANRAEIAARVLRSARAHGCSTVAVYSEADRDLPYVTMADDAVALSGTSAVDTYLHIEQLLWAAHVAGADAVHPGYGFLSEQAAFAEACERAGLTFVGPPAKVIAQMGSKVEAKSLMQAADVPVLPGATVEAGADPEQLASLAAPVGFPLLVKAAFGGGGRGMRVVEEPDALADAVASASAEAAAAFGDGTVFLERLVVGPRHVEVQVFGDTHGTVAHLFERECSIQRRHQKLLEESPSPGITEDTRRAMCEAAVAAARAIGYVNAGTVEFVVDRDERFSFLEVNTRLQVEHPVTELLTGLDLVELQLRVAEGEPLPVEVLEPTRRGHAIEVRLYAEDPVRFVPASGTLRAFELPSSEGVRVDAGYASGSVVPAAYDAMLAKVVAWAPTRTDAASRLAAALRGARLRGVTTNRDLLVGVLEDEDFLAGRTDTAFLEAHDPATLVARTKDPRAAFACVLAALWSREAAHASSPQPADVPAGWRNVGPQHQSRRYLLDGASHEVSIVWQRAGLVVLLDGEARAVRGATVHGDEVRAEFDGRVVRASVAREGATVYVDGTLGNLVLVEEPVLPVPHPDEAPGSLHAPLPGAVRRVAVSDGDLVEAGDLLVVLEAMKMEHAIRAVDAGRIAQVLVTEGDQVEAGDVLVVVEAAGGEDGTS